jgi:hypothetical protein
MRETINHPSGDDFDIPLLGRLLNSRRESTPLFNDAQEAVREFDRVTAYLREQTARRTRPGLALGYLNALGHACFEGLRYGADVQEALLRILVALGPLAELELKQIEAKKRRGTAPRTPRTPRAKAFPAAEQPSRAPRPCSIALDNGGPFVPEVVI